MYDWLHGLPALAQKSVTASLPGAAAALQRRRQECMNKNPKNPGSLGGEMRMRVKEHCKNLSNHTRSNYMHACKTFDSWRKEAGLSNKHVRDHPRESVVQWSEHLKTSGISQSTIHTMVAGCCCGLGIPSNGIVKHGTARWTKPKAWAVLSVLRRRGRRKAIKTSFVFK